MRLTMFCLAATTAAFTPKPVPALRPQIDRAQRCFRLRCRFSEAEKAALLGPPKALLRPQQNQNLAAGWREALSDNGQTYYYNDATGEATWEAPLAANAGSLPPGWRLVSDDNGQTYYYNDATGEATWEAPLAEADRLPPGWRRMSDHGQTYYLNDSTGEATWEVPVPVEHDVYDPRSATQTYQQWAERAH